MKPLRAHRTGILFVAALALLFVAAACSSNDADDVTADSAGASSTSATAATGELEAEALCAALEPVAAYQADGFPTETAEAQTAAADLQTLEERSPAALRTSIAFIRAAAEESAGIDDDPSDNPTPEQLSEAFATIETYRVDECDVTPSTTAGSSRTTTGGGGVTSTTNRQTTTTSRPTTTTAPTTTTTVDPDPPSDNNTGPQD